MNVLSEVMLSFASCVRGKWDWINDDGGNGDKHVWLSHLLVASLVDQDYSSVLLLLET